jgi:hypothetical protein
MTNKLKEFLFESYNVKKNLEENPNELDDRLIDAKDLVSEELCAKLN